MIEVWDRLYDAFAARPDPRVEHTKQHPLIDIISIAICAVIRRDGLPESDCTPDCAARR